MLPAFLAAFLAAFLCAGPRMLGIVTGMPEAPPAPVPVRPPALRQGDTIALVAPASPVTEKKVAEAVRHLERRGYRVRVMPNVAGEHGYLAGADRERAADINQAFADPDVKMVLCLRGGYGSPRLLDLVDYDLIRRNPKVFAGYSDITALLIALHQRANLTTFHGPMAMTDFSGRYGLAPYSTKHFWPLVEAPERAGATVPESFADWGGSAPAKLGVLASIAPGRAEGILTGGNLSTIASLLGTPFEIEVRDRILFLEDVNEEPFRIDRMLAQLRLAGKLGECRGVLLGAFTRCTARPGNPSLDLDEVIEEYLGSLPVPVLAGFPAGHLPDQATLPFGSRVRLDADAGKLELLELPTTP